MKLRVRLGRRRECVNRREVGDQLRGKRPGGEVRAMLAEQRLQHASGVDGRVLLHVMHTWYPGQECQGHRGRKVRPSSQSQYDTRVPRRAQEEERRSTRARHCRVIRDVQDCHTLVAALRDGLAVPLTDAAQHFAHLKERCGFQRAVADAQAHTRSPLLKRHFTTRMPMIDSGAELRCVHYRPGSSSAWPSSWHRNYTSRTVEKAQDGASEAQVSDQDALGMNKGEIAHNAAA